jgi:hypothetical protein
MAIAHVGGRAAISALTESSSEANYCNLFYEHLRRVALSTLNWGFNVKYRALADLGNPPDHWGYQYAYPSDCLRFLKIQTTLKTPVTYEIAMVASDGEGNHDKSILTDEAEATGKYVLDVSSPAEFSHAFIEFFSLYLAEHICGPLTKDTRRTVALREARVLAQQEAKAFGANEGQKDPQDFAEPDWLTGR